MQDSSYKKADGTFPVKNKNLSIYLSCIPTCIYMYIHVHASVVVFHNAVMQVNTKKLFSTKR